MTFENSAEQFRPRDVQQPSTVSLLPSAVEYQTFGANALDQRTQASNGLIGCGLLTNLQFNFGAQESPVLLAQASAEETGKVIDYPANKTGDQSYKGGMDWEQSADSRTASEKLQDFLGAAGHNATKPENYKQYVQDEIDKLIGVGEGLNIAKEQTKGAAAAGWKALTDGTVADFLSKPNAINDPLFKVVGNALDSMSKDPDATNKALAALGTAIAQSSEHYSALPKREQGHVIGETMFGMVNPEGSTEAADAGLKMAGTVAGHVDKAVAQTVQQSMEAIQDIAKTAPEYAQQAKQMLYDYIKSKGFMASELERGGQIPEGFFDNLEKPPEGTVPVGKGGDWPVLNERPSPDVIQQTSHKSCVAAVGEMLSNGLLKQEALIDTVGTKPEALAPLLGPEWKSGFIKGEREKTLDALLAQKQSWGAELRDDFYHRVRMGHMVVVDGLDEAGNVMIRDPQDGTRYEMTKDAFLHHWSDRVLFPSRK
jgi:hypothetical protein